MTKRKIDNVELDDIASSSNDPKIDYNKNIIEKILYASTNMNIEVFFSYSNEEKQDKIPNSATGELIERINFYLAQQKQDPPYYLVIDCTSSALVDTAYLAHLHYSNKHQFWKLTLTPLVNYDQVDKRESVYLSNQLQDIDTSIWGAKNYYDTHIDSARIEQVVEHARLRI